MKTVFVMLLCAAGVALAAPVSPPNVVIILADDLGYGDVQCYNPERGKIPTPNIDRLATQGLRFTDAHSSSGVCSPSRYTLLTGRYHWRSRLQAGIVGYLEKPLISAERLTIGRLAQRRGYRTAAIGKWHLGWEWDIPGEQREWFDPGRKAPETTEAMREAWRAVYSKPIAGGPVTRGFDEYFGTDVPNWPPYCFIENDRTVGIPSQFLPASVMAAPAMISKQGPALADWKLEGVLPALADRAAAFIADCARGDRPFLLYMPLTSPHTPLAVNEEWKGRSGLNVYGDFVMETDAAVGRVMDALDRAGAAGRTLMILTSDNGSAHRIKPVGEIETLGHALSGPLRGYKASVWEGGHRVPFIVRWPEVVAPGRVSGRLAHQADIMATLADILGETLPPDAGEDSFSLLPLLRGEDAEIRPHAVSCAASGEPGVREGEWKFIPSAKPQLYNLAEDIGESRNLAAEHPERVEAMRSLLERLIVAGRSTPGARQKNDVRVNRHPTAPQTPK